MVRLLSVAGLMTAAAAFTNPLSKTRLHVSSAPSSSDITQDKYDDLLKWFVSKNEQSVISSKLAIQPSPSGGYGAFASSDLSKGEILLRIPKSCCVTLTDVFNDVDCGPAFKQLFEQAGPGTDTVVIAGYLAKEYLLSQEYERRLKEVEDGTSVDASAKKRLESVKFGPYLRSLPWRAGVNSQEHVLFWEEENVDALLKGSLAYDDAVEIRSSVKYATKILNGIVGPVIKRARGSEDEEENTEGFRLPWQQPKEKSTPSDTIVEGLEEAVTGAFVICLSRSFAWIFRPNVNTQEEILVPILDILQHSNNPNIKQGNAEDEPNMIEVKAAIDIIAGEELFNQYKAEEDVNMPYHKFFTRFGFVPGVVEPMEDLIKNRSTIFFPKQQTV